MSDTATTQDPKELGRVFAHEKNMGGLDEHPNSHAHKAGTGMLYFFGGRETGKLGFDDHDTMEFFQGLLIGMREIAQASRSDD